MERAGSRSGLVNHRCVGGKRGAGSLSLSERAPSDSVELPCFDKQQPSYPNPRPCGESERAAIMAARSTSTYAWALR
jgi:hypothetical protein